MIAPSVALGEIAAIEREGVDPRTLDPSTPYVGLEDIVGDGRVSKSASVTTAELASTKFRFTEKHILFGKLRPYLRKIARPDFSGVCSTDIIPIRPSNQIDRNYLFHYLRTDKIIDLATSIASGANLPRISPNLLCQFEVPLPPLSEQRRVAAILDRADALRRKQMAQLGRLTEVAAALFTEIFGPMERNSRDWPLARFGDLVATTKLGIVRGASDMDPSHAYQYVRMDSITTDGRLRLSDLRCIKATDAEVRESSLSSGDLLFNTRNSRELVGKTALFDGKGTFLFNNNIMRIRFTDRVDPRFAAAAFQRPLIKTQIDARKAGTTSVFAIYWKNLATIIFPVPPKELQNRFAKADVEFEKLRRLLLARAQGLNRLFSALQSGVFGARDGQSQSAASLAAE
jgi:type I restriction enzyme S subunit